MGEKLLLRADDIKKTKIVILQPGVFYGINPSKNLIQLIMQIKSGKPAIFFGKDGFYRMFVDIEKVVDAMLLAEKNGKHKEAYLVADTSPLKTLEFYEIISETAHAPFLKVPLPVFLSRAGEKAAYLAGTLNVHVRIATIVGEFGRHHYFSVAKACREISFVPHASSREGIKKMIESALLFPGKM